jgi:outer membrane lipoprotein carrier protein
MKPFSTCAFALVAASAAAQTPAAPSAPEVAASLQRKYDTIRDFSADFVHSYEGGVLKRKREERGILQVKKPGKMRWAYKPPDEKLFVSDGVQLYQFFPDANRVLVSPVPQADSVTAGVLFLVGRGNLTRDFDVTFGAGGAADTWALHLQPKQPQPEYDWLELVVARGTLRIQSLTVGEKQGGRSTFHFTNFKENAGLADRVFVFTPPRGAEVTHGGPAKH